MTSTSYHRIKSSPQRSLYTYPKSPGKLDLFSKYGYVQRPKSAAANYLEHMLSSTSLTTQKLAHDNIQKIGTNVYEAKLRKFQREKEEAVAQAIHVTTKNLRIEYEQEVIGKLALAEAEKLKALKKQQNYYEQLAIRTESNRDKFEEERKNRLVHKMYKEKEAALKEQWERSEKVKNEAIGRALTEQHKRLRTQAALEREKAITSALRVASEQHVTKAALQVDVTRKECQEIAIQSEERQRELHLSEIQRLNERIAVLTQEMQKFHQNQQLARKDFVEIEGDYAKFLDLTEVPCHSDYLISPRKLKHGVGKGRSNQLSQTNLIALSQNSCSVQTEIQISARR